MDQRVSFITLVVSDLDTTRSVHTRYFADPDGFRWEVAHNPGEIGQSVLP